MTETPEIIPIFLRDGRGSNFLPMDAENIRKIFKYEPETGKFYWLQRGVKVRAGQLAGRDRGDGYWVVGYNYKLYLMHRLVWLYVYGKWPEHEIDHINLNPSDNRVDNLRDITHSQNAGNCRARGKSGVKGVFWDEGRQKWLANIMHNYRSIHIGRYETWEEAKTARDEKGRELFGENYRP